MDIWAQMFSVKAGGLWSERPSKGDLQASSLSHPQTRKQLVVLLCLGLGPVVCDKLELCVGSCVWQTPFLFELLNNNQLSLIFDSM